MTRKIIVGTLLVLFVFITGILVTREYYTRHYFKPIEQSQVLVDKIKKVCKLVSVEGHFTEFHDYADPEVPFSLFNPVSINLKSFMPRTAMLRVKGKVSVGYDLSTINIEANETQRIITISKLPEPDILSVDHDIDYFNKEDYYFHSFSDEDYVRISKSAKKSIEEAARKSNLFTAADEQGKDLLELITFMVETTGWKLVIAQTEDRPHLEEQYPN